MRHKLIFFIHEPSYTGGPLVVLNLLKKINREKISPAVVFLYHGPMEEEFKKIGVEVFHISTRKTSIEIAFFSHFFKILSIFRKIRPSLIHINSTVLYPVLFFSKLIGAKSIIHVHELVKKRPAFLKKIALQYCDRLIFVSKASREALNKHMELKKNVVIHNGIADDWFRDFKKSPRDTIQLTMVGLITPLKGQDLLLSAFAKLIHEGTVCKLNFIGEIKNSPKKYQHYFFKLKEIVSANNLNDLVHFNGLVKNIKREMQNCDILVHTSMEESFSLSTLEAMALGKPVVAFMVGGISELIVHGSTGFLVEFGDINELKKSLLLLISDRELRETFGKNAKKRAREFFDLKNKTVEMENVYYSLFE